MVATGRGEVAVRETVGNSYFLESQLTGFTNFYDLREIVERMTSSF